MSSPADDVAIDRLKDGMRWMWSLGDYPSIARHLEPHAQALASACSIRPGTSVLDVAAGNGNFALAASRLGAAVTASDLTPRMVELGRARSAAEGADIEWREADAENLPFRSGSFDIVASVFGAMFAPRPGLVASEMFRVARPGGLVAMANYSPGGFLGRLSGLLSTFTRRPEIDLPSPFEWGDPDEARRRFGAHTSSIEVEARTLVFEFDSIDHFIEFWERTNAPQVALKTMLPAETYQQVQGAAIGLAEELNESTGGRVALRSPYINVIARKP